MFVVYLCQKLLEVRANQSSYFISIQKMKTSSRVVVIVNNTICVAVKRAAALTRSHMHTYGGMGGERKKGRANKRSRDDTYMGFDVPF